MGKLLLFATIFLFLGILHSVAPSMQVSNMTPEGNITVRDMNNINLLMGYCNASDGDSPDVLYYWEWFRNKLPFSNGQHGNLASIQENATPDSVSNDTGFTNPNNAEDNDYTTFATHATKGANRSVYYNYSASIPAGGISGATWQVKHGTRAIENLTLASACYSRNPIELGIWSYRSGGSGATYSSRPMCYDGSVWVGIGTLSTGAAGNQYIYDQNIFFNIPAVMFTQNIRENVANITSSFEGEWILQCIAQDLTANSSALNSSTLNVTNWLKVAWCGNLATKNMRYNLTQNVVSNGATCFTVTNENITLSCENRSLTSDNTPATYGVYSNYLNTTIDNCTIKDFQTGIGFGANGDSATVMRNNITALTWINNGGDNNEFNFTTPEAINLGNIYYLTTGTASWNVYDITVGSPPGWATGGANRPFSSSIVEWTGNGADYHPFTNNVSAATVVDTTISASTLLFGNLDPGTNDNAAFENPVVLVNTDNSNTNIDVYLFGTNITNNAATLAFGGTNITVYNESGSASISNPINLSAMGFLNNTAANNGYRENLPPSASGKTNSNYSFYFWIDIPAGQAASTEYHSVVTIRSIADGQSPA